ncbi:MAG: hypothetical protein JWP50_2239 [Phenylobacterium sp.]|nr:hypothetical protein [Phenylobacterium sp.]
MTHRQLKPDLTGSSETLDDLLGRLRSISRKPVRPKGFPPGFGHFVSSRRPPGGMGGAEAPIPADKVIADCFAAI